MGRRPTSNPLAWLFAGLLLAACSQADDPPPSGIRCYGPTSYVALGDSIAAGGGAPPYDATSGGCYRSPRAWPVALVAALPSLGLEAFSACGGAKVANLLAPWPERGVPAQVPGDQDPTVGLVTVNVGANDLGYGAFLYTCVLADCSISTPAGEQELRSHLDALRAALVNDLYPALRIAFPSARIVHVGYPRLVTTQATPLCPWLTPDEQRVIDEVLKELNSTIAGAVEQAGDDRLEFVDVTDATDHHELCTVDPWVVDLSTTDGSGGHPDADGYAAMAAAVEANL
jgi:lysophospholipase L1-like esterase